MTNGKDIEKKEFGRRLYQILREKELTQSDVAQELFGREIDPRGRSVASKRALVSKWVRGVAIPGPKNLHKLAKFLEMEPADIVPSHGRVNNEFVARSGPGVDQITLVINQVVTKEQFFGIAAILQGRKK